ncbi:MAG: hypothetical protein AAGG48_23270 [Planctomycetota bacterium]
MAKTVRFIAFLLSVVCFSSCRVGYAEDLRMRFVWSGSLPVLPRIENPFEKDCEDVDLNAGRQFVDGASKGVRDMVVYVAPSRRDRDRWRQPKRKQAVRIEVEDCRIKPRIVVAQAGDRLKIDQKDDAAIHSLNLGFVRNPPLGIYQPADGEQTRELTSPEPAAVLIGCNVHPWMKAYLFVLDHSFIGVSDAKGELVIRGLPSKASVPLRFFHPNGQIYSVRIGGERKFLDRGRMPLPVNDGVTDLGDIVIDARSFEPPKPESEASLNRQK